MEVDGLLKSHRKKPLFDWGALPCKTVQGQDQIRRIIPHRDPFLLIDAITGLDVEQGLISCARYVDPGDPVFAGHFPDFPIYPGVLQVEMAGQAGLSLHYFVLNNRTDIGADAEPVMLRATKILGALYLEPVLPGMNLVILGRKLDYDGYFATMIGQVIADGKVCTVVAGEVVFV